jgi:hypothetical protein
MQDIEILTRKQHEYHSFTGIASKIMYHKKIRITENVQFQGKSASKSLFTVNAFGLEK